MSKTGPYCTEYSVVNSSSPVGRLVQKGRLGPWRLHFRSEVAAMLCRPPDWLSSLPCHLCTLSFPTTARLGERLLRNFSSTLLQRFVQPPFLRRTLHRTVRAARVKRRACFYRHSRAETSTSRNFAPAGQKEGAESAQVALKSFVSILSNR
jgi:hypothetical protein